MVFVALVVVAGGFIVTQFLTSAIDYYCNVDEVGVRDGCDDDRRMRVQGIVLQDSVRKVDGATTFTLAFNEKKIDISYLGDPGGIFQECIPVVAHGRLIEGAFESDRIEVKHSNEYVEVNDERLDKANKEAAACSVLEG
jgi:cytochrome c-type biogenesis protein CcmE